MNGYELSRQWFDFAFENKRHVRPIHHAVIFWIYERANQSKWVSEFQLPTNDACETLGISDKHSFLKAFNELVEFGAVRVVEESKNRFTARWISIENCEMYRVEKPHATTHAKQHAIPHATTHASTTKVKQIESNKTKKQSTPIFDPMNCDLSSFSSDFVQYWSDWCAYRKEKKNPLSARAAKLQLEDLKASGELAAKQMIRNSIKGGWSGLFPLKDHELSQLKTDAPPSRRVTLNDKYAS